MTTVNKMYTKISGEWVECGGSGNKLIVPTFNPTTLGVIGTAKLHPPTWENGIDSKTIYFDTATTYPDFGTIFTTNFTVYNYNYTNIPQGYEIDPSFSGITDISNALVTLTLASHTIAGQYKYYGMFENTTRDYTVDLGEVSSNGKSTVTTNICDVGGTATTSDVCILEGKCNYSDYPDKGSITLTCIDCDIYGQLVE